MEICVVAYEQYKQFEAFKSYEVSSMNLLNSLKFETSWKLFGLAAFCVLAGVFINVKIDLVFFFFLENIVVK